VRQTWTGCILLSTALSSSAVTLGRHSGAAIIGQPLDVRVQVLLAPGEDLANQCLKADVFYGDAQVSPGAVRSTPQKTAPDAEASVRIQAALPINEPIVTLYVKAGCDTAFTRRFVLLADPLNEPVASATRAPESSTTSPVRPPLAQTPTSPSGATAPRSARAGTEAGATRGDPPAPSTGSVAAPTRPVPGNQAAARPNATRPPSVVRRPPAPVATPRLQLDPIDLDPGIERDPVLKLSPSLLSEPGTSDEARAAAGLLWKAVNASPEDILRDARKLAALEAEAGQLRDARSQNQNNINDLSTQLEQARDQRYRNWLVYLLGGLLLLALLALLVVWRRRPAMRGGSEASQAWWSSDPADKTVLDELAQTARKDARRKGPKPAAAVAENESMDIDLNLDHDSSLDSLQPLSGDDGRDSKYPSDAASALQARDRKDFSPSAIGVSRSVATEELFDVQQQADFFVSLGEDEQAIQVLRNHLAESHEPSPLAYLDLFKLYHRLGRRAEYDALRDEFNHVFNAGAPPFNHYTDAGRGLEAYETAFSRIQSLWPQERVLDLIEESIFRDANDDQVEVFDLEAYRELLLLHAIAKDLVQRDSPPGARQTEFRNTNMQPLKAEGKLLGALATAGATTEELVVGRNTEPMGLDAALPVSSRLGLDINLDDLSEFSAFEASLPEVSPAIEPTARPADDPRAPVRNMIDFEVLDFMPPDEPDSQPGDKH
jgi:hypothetical protein